METPEVKGLNGMNNMGELPEFNGGDRSADYGSEHPVPKRRGHAKIPAPR
jgi:hypothetical protein